MERIGRRPPRKTEGMTLIEIMVVVVIMAMIATAVGMQVLKAMTDAKQKQALTDAMNIKSIATAYLMNHASAECPTVADLVDDGSLDQDTSRVDPWDQPYRIDCEGTRILVRSAGPDRQLGTDDDIEGRAH